MTAQHLGLRDPNDVQSQDRVREKREFYSTNLTIYFCWGVKMSSYMIRYQIINEVTLSG